MRPLLVLPVPAAPFTPALIRIAKGGAVRGCCGGGVCAQLRLQDFDGVFGVIQEVVALAQLSLGGDSSGAQQAQVVEYSW